MDLGKALLSLPSLRKVQVIANFLTPKRICIDRFHLLGFGRSERFEFHLI